MRFEINHITNCLVGALSLVIIVDPPNTYLHLKDPLFIFLLLYVSFNYKPIPRLFFPFVLALLVWCISTNIGYSSLMIEDTDFNIGILKSFMPLLLLGWIKNLDFRNKLLVPCLIISSISITVLLVMIYYKEYEAILYGYFTKDNGLMMISRRNFIGIQFASAFYRSTPIIILPLAKICHDVMFCTKYKTKILQFLILFLGLFAGGNRACMLSAIGIPITIYLYKLYTERKYYKFLLIAFSICFVLLYTLYLLLSDSSETSNAIKFGHIESYINYFNNNIEYIFLGSGAGSKFYSNGFQALTVQTEWTYIELIRYFGLIGCAIILWIFMHPLILMIKRIKSKEIDLSIIVGYVFYLLLAGTNPLLLSSSGMIVCLFIYSWVYSKNTINENREKKSKHIAFNI